MNDIKSRLYNHSRWARTSQFSTASCKSLESRYRSPQHWHIEPIKIPIDILDAFVIEDALIQLPKYNLKLLIYCYISSGYNYDSFCKKNKIKGTKLLSKNSAFKLEQLKSENMLQLIVDLAILC